MEVTGSIAHELITRGWTQLALEDEKGQVCLVGAALCALGLEPELESLAQIPSHMHKAIHQVTEGRLQQWNDEPGRTYDEVLRAAKHADEMLDALRD